jgi:hypothetical protein
VKKYIQLLDPLPGNLTHSSLHHTSIPPQTINVQYRRRR